MSTDVAAGWQPAATVVSCWLTVEIEGRCIPLHAMQIS